MMQQITRIGGIDEKDELSLEKPLLEFVIKAGTSYVNTRWETTTLNVGEANLVREVSSIVRPFLSCAALLCFDLKHHWLPV
ncbi:jg16490 [Pararge aegeria aegeria]|uniref:Jg16490 protein n=1 Tax=Pararge aegeria aegeria TaxID=348720 RepID=A0A8S4RJD0_9NEOP|nr:jg16490 [Pararge aegeria aegeria]